MDRAVLARPVAASVPRAPRGGAAALERDADQRATDALSVAAPGFVARAAAPAGGVAPSSLGALLRAGGMALPAELRARFEPRFGTDFGAVRIHHGPAAQRAAHDQRAQAFAWGSHLVFGVHRWQPSSAAGAALLAHELAHVAQQAHGAPVSVRCKTDPEAPTVKWYQRALDQVELSNRRMAEGRKSGGFVMTPPYYDLEKAILDLCEAVDAKNSEVARKTLDALLKRGSLWVHLQILSRDLLTELSARLFEMGLEAEAGRLRTAYADQSKDGPYNDDMYGTQRRMDYLKRLVAGASSEAKADSPEALAAGMHRFARVFTVLRRQYLEIDWKAVEWARQTNASRYTLRPMMSADEVYREVRAQLEAWHAGWSTFVQSAMDSARADLESATPSGSGAALLAALRQALLGEIKAELFPKDDKQNISGAEAFETTKTTMDGPGKGRIDDAFQGGKTARSVPVTTYDPEQPWVRELRTSIDASWRQRVDQVDALGRLFGVLDALQPDKEFGKTMQNAEAAKANEASIRNTAGGRLRLDNDDDWRAFLLQKYRDLTQPAGGGSAMTPSAALKEVVGLLFGTLQAFTIHARFTNLYDVGKTPYFNRPFPRTLTGQLVQDCGVYAMRVAYMLSLVRKELGLRFFFVRLPAHVSLVVNGQQGSELPTFVMANNHYKVWDPGWLDAQRASWQKFQDPATDKAPTGPADDTQFVGELAAADFISGPVDMPARVSEVPPPTADLKADQRRLWAHYQSSAIGDDVFGSATQSKEGENRLFHKHYLELTEKLRAVYNEVVMPFWNESAPAAWDAFAISLAGSASQPRTEVAVAELLKLLEPYKTAYYQASEPVNKRMQGYEAEQRRLSERLRADPKLAKAGTRLTSGVRAAMLVKQAWEWYAEALDDYEVKQLGRSEDEVEPLTDVSAALLPRWVPTDRNRMSRLD